jgi:hypothetical protein
MASNDAPKKFFDAVNEGYDAFIDAVRAASDRGHRVSTALIEDAQRSQRETIDLAKKWAEAPLDVVGFYSSVVDVSTRAQSRSLEAARQWFGEMADAQQETREVLQRMITANRQAGEAAVQVARGLFSRASEAVQSASTAALPSGDGRRTREPARAESDSSGDAGL